MSSTPLVVVNRTAASLAKHCVREYSLEVANEHDKWGIDFVTLRGKNIDHTPENDERKELPIASGLRKICTPVGETFFWR